MLKKYSNSRDCIYGLALIVIFGIISGFSRFQFFNFETSEVLSSMLSLSGILFGFILTIITMLFMFDPTKNPIFKKLQKDNLFNQIFKRFFDSLIVIVISIVFFLLTNIYFSKITFEIWKLVIELSTIINIVIIFFMILISLRLYRCLFLLERIYRAISDNSQK